ncbi:MAG: hypothetical protein KTR28_02075, partial [Micavibrio sp.]|nr:hypothetical protein [Micavibrio sp.]
MNNSNHTPLFTNQWRFVPLSILCVLAALIWYSFFNAPFSNLWLTFDERAYFILNDTLSDGGAWGKLVAYSNTKLYDAASAVILVGLLFVYAVLSKQTDFKHRLAAIIFAALYMAVTTF